MHIIEVLDDIEEHEAGRWLWKSQDRIKTAILAKQLLALGVMMTEKDDSALCRDLQLNVEEEHDAQQQWEEGDTSV